MYIISNSDAEYENVIGIPSMSIADAMKRIDILGAGILFINNENRELIGCVTDGDIRRWLLNGGSLAANVSSIINENPICFRIDCEKEAISTMTSKKLRAIPILDENKRIIRVYFNSLSDFKEIDHKEVLPNIPVVIMAGGIGSRLYPYTKVLPKPLIPIGDRPIIEHIMDQFTNFGVADFFAIVNYKKNLIKAYFSDDNRTDITFIDEKEYLDTGGGLSLLRDKIDSTFILTNCDILIRDDISKIVEYHIDSQNMVTIIASLKKTVIPYGVIHAGKNGVVETMEEKPEIPYLANTGCYVVDNRIFDYIGDGEKISFPDIIKRCKGDGCKVGSYPISECAWLDMGQFDVMDEMKMRLIGDYK